MMAMVSSLTKYGATTVCIRYCPCQDKQRYRPGIASRDLGLPLNVEDLPVIYEGTGSVIAS